MDRIRHILLTGLLLIAIPRIGAAQIVVNSFPLGSAVGGSTVFKLGYAVSTDGNVLALWTEFVGGKSTVRARPYSASGLPLGPDLRVDVSAHASGTTIASDLRGGYLAAWRRDAPDDRSFRGRRLMAAGTPVGDEVQVDPEADYLQSGIGAGISSGVAFVWSENGALSMRLYDVDGRPGFVTPIGNGGAAAVVPLPDGGFVVLSNGTFSSDGDHARLFDADGTPRGPAFLVSDASGPNRFDAAHLAVDQHGRLAVVGVSVDGVVARRFDASGAPLGDAFLVDAPPPGASPSPDVAFDATGNLYVVWSSANDVVRARAYDTSGVALGPAVPISSTPAAGVRVGALPDGTFMNVFHAGVQVSAAVVSLCTPGTTTCGDGIFASQCEQCDSGAANSDTSPDACRTDCRVAHCGDAIIDSGEQCDDGNPSSCDGCSAQCQVEQGTGCGDGVLEPTCEACDDGNAVAGDGCTPACTLERVPGGGSPFSDCYAEWVVDNAANDPRYDTRGDFNRKQTCFDNDPRCDFDGGVAGSCTFHVRVCANNTDRPSCLQPVRLQSWVLTHPSASQALAHPALSSAREAFNGIAGEIVGPSMPNSCSGVRAIPVPLRGAAPAYGSAKLKLTTRAVGYDSVVDGDALSLICRPPN